MSKAAVADSSGRSPGICDRSHQPRISALVGAGTLWYAIDAASLLTDP